MSEAQLHRDLYLPHRSVVEQARNDTRGGSADGGPGTGELRVIERIEKFELQLVLEALAKAGVLDQGQVGLRLARIAENVTACISVRAGIVRSRPESRQVKPMIGRGMSSVPEAIRSGRLPVPVESKPVCWETVKGNPVRKNRIPPICHPPINLSASGFQPAAKALALAKRQLVNPAGGPKVLDVEVGGAAVLIEVPRVQRTALGV